MSEYALNIPKDIELEQDVLGVFLLDDRTFPLYSDKLNEDCFYDDKNKYVFKALFSLFKRGSDIDLTTTLKEIGRLNLASKFDNTGYYLMTIINRVSNSSHLDEWIKILMEISIQRKIISICQWGLSKSQNQQCDSFELQSQLLSKIDKITKFISSDVSFKQTVNEAFSEMRRAQDNEGIVGIKTKFDFLDKNMLGLVAPDVTVIAARPSQGKTTLAFNIALNIAKSGVPVGFFSFEMKAIQLAQKTFSYYIPESVNRIRQGNLADNQWDILGDNFSEIENLPIYINDSGTLSIERMKSIVKSWQVKYGIKAVFIDYLQLVTSSVRGNREAQVSQLARDIKLMAMDCNLPIILLSQLSREGATDEPELHYLRSSGEIEQSADNVLFLHPNSEYTRQIYPNWVEGDPEWVIDLLLKKCRLGTKGKRPILFNAAYNQFREIKDDYQINEIF